MGGNFFQGWTDQQIAEHNRRVDEQNRRFAQRGKPAAADAGRLEPDQIVAYAAKSMAESVHRATAGLAATVEPKGKTLVEVFAAEAESKRIRQDAKPVMNKLESDWYRLLSLGTWDGREVRSLRAQALRFKIANGAWYRPDVTCLLDGKMAAFECKGPKQMRSMARGMLTVKTAAFQWPEVEWTLVWREAGRWRTQRVLP